MHELPTEYHRIETRRADVVMQVEDKEGERYIFHIEMQNSNDDKMALRMLRYYIVILPRPRRKRPSVTM